MMPLPMHVVLYGNVGMRLSSCARVSEYVRFISCTIIHRESYMWLHGIHRLNSRLNNERTSTIRKS